MEQEHFLYMVVQFSSERDVDLVPSSCVVQKEGQFFCSYPPSDDYGKIEGWLQELKEPEETWEIFPVQIISRPSK